MQYRETKTGFECIHLPSIDLKSLEPSTSKTTAGSYAGQGIEGVHVPPSRPSIVKKASKISFVRREKGKEREASFDAATSLGGRETPGPSSTGVQQGTGHQKIGTSPSSGSSSFFGVVHGEPHANGADPTTNVGKTSIGSVVEELDVVEEGTSTPTQGTGTIGGKAKTLPPIPRDFGATSSSTPTPTPDQGQAAAEPLPEDVPPRSHARSPSPLPSGALDRETFEAIGKTSRMGVRFEINVIKVPWLPLHGIQFRRASGDGWQYQMLARRVLTELKL